MDIQYILLNTIVYGTFAILLSVFFGFGKMLNFAIGSFMTAFGYIMYDFVHNGFTLLGLTIAVGVLGIYLFVNWGLLKYFPHEKQRDHVGIISTLGLSIFLENGLNYLYGPIPVSLNFASIHLFLLVSIFLFFALICRYFFKISFVGKIYSAIAENSKSACGLGIPVYSLLQIVFGVGSILLIGVALLLLNEANLKASDGLFYMIKGIGIMILVGISKKEYMLIGALLYVIIEYILFIKIGLPISYKETFILVIILGVLLFKSEGLFTLRRRII